MNKNRLLKKSMALGIIMLFVGASVIVPNIKILTNVENVFSARAKMVFTTFPSLVVIIK